MIGHLYRYPHPHDLTRFIYVGQGANRDYLHRLGKSSFGRRFKRIFVNVKLPQPIREEFEIIDQAHLNVLETVWMFQYKTWREYLGGMNLTFPGSSDYKNIGFLRGLDAIETGQIQELGRIYGPINGRKNIELYGSPQTAEGSRKGGLNRPHETAVLAGHIGGLKGGRITANIPGHMSRAGKLGGPLSSSRHLRWHITGTISGRGNKWVNPKPNPRCVFCSEQNLIIAYA